MATSPTSVEMIKPPENSQIMELINGDGDFNESGFEDFIRGAAASIPVIAIIGPQSSGKSSLLNHLFGTNFRVMNAANGRSKTTDGIWIAKAPHMEPLTVVLDLEGTDGKERGQDETTFEKQSALFAIAVAHTVIINIWCRDVGRENAANRPLLKAIFEAMLSLFTPQKTTLVFVVRDSDNMTPSELLERDLKEDINKIWEAVVKPLDHEGTLLTEIFNVKVAVLSNYVYIRPKFDEEVAQLKLQLISLTKHDNIDLPASKMSLSSAKKTWDIIKESKGIKVPPFRVMVATVRCEEIAKDELRLLQSDQTWLDLQQNAKTQLVKDFGAQTNSILTKYLSEYDKKTMNFESSTKGRYDQQVTEVRSSKRQYLTVEALQVVHSAYKNTLDHLCSEVLQSFKDQLTARGQKFSLSAIQTCRDSCLRQFDHQCSDYATIEPAKWEDDVVRVRQQLLRDINGHALYQLQDELSTNLNTQVSDVIKEYSVKDIWACVRSVIKSESERAKSAAVGIFGTEHKQIVSDLEQYARNTVKTRFRDESRDVEKLMEIRFVLALSKDGDTMDKEKAYSQCLDILAAMAVIRLDDTYDVVRKVLHSELMGGVEISTDYLSSVTWEKVPHKVTLITPMRCREIWTRFKPHMERHLAKVDKYKQAFAEHTKVESAPEKSSTEEKGRAWTPPTWAILGLSVLGVTAFVGVLICYPEIVPALVISAALAKGIAEQFTMDDDIPKKHPNLMESLHDDLVKAYECMATIHKITKLAVSTVA